MQRAYKFRFYPTPYQVEVLAQTFGYVRFVYNSVLHGPTCSYYERQEKSAIRIRTSQHPLNSTKRESNFLGSMAHGSGRE
ncbi:TPA: helix-turn-helix domain-containing protein [Salmonella enterica]